MIASGAEVRAALAGVLRLWRGDVSGFLAFDRSLEGFWRSFTAMILGAPVHGLLLFVGRGESSGPLSSWHHVMVEAIAYVTTWIAFPLLITRISHRLDRDDRYFDYMVPYNWAALAQLMLFTLAAIIRPVLPDFVGSVLMLVAIAAVLHLQWFIAREGLGISRRLAFLIVVADLSLSIFVGGVADYLKA